MAHMFLSVPQFVTTQIKRFPKVMSSDAIPPEFLLRQPVFAELLRKPNPSQSQINCSNASSRMQVSDQPDSQSSWVVESPDARLGPFPFAEALRRALLTNSDQVIIKCERSNNVLQKDYILSEFQSFARQLETYLVENSKKLTLLNQKTIDSIIVPSKGADPKTVLENFLNFSFSSQEESPLQPAAAGRVLKPGASPEANPYFNSVAYVATFESRSDEASRLRETDYKQLCVRNPPKAWQGNQTKAPPHNLPSLEYGSSQMDTRSHFGQPDDVARGRQQSMDVVGFSQKSELLNQSCPEPTVQVKLEGGKAEQFNLDKVFSICDGASQFVKKMWQCNIQFSGSQKAEPISCFSGFMSDDQGSNLPASTLRGLSGTTLSCAKPFERPPNSFARPPQPNPSFPHLSYTNSVGSRHSGLPSTQDSRPHHTPNSFENLSHYDKERVRTNHAQHAQAFMNAKKVAFSHEYFQPGNTFTSSVEDHLDRLPADSLASHLEDVANAPRDLRNTNKPTPNVQRRPPPPLASSSTKLGAGQTHPELANPYFSNTHQSPLEKLESIKNSNKYQAERHDYEYSRYPVYFAQSMGSLNTSNQHSNPKYQARAYH